MIRIISVLGAVAALTVSILAGVLGVLSLATGNLWLTGGLTATALAAVWVSARVPLGRVPAAVRGARP